MTSGQAIPYGTQLSSFDDLSYDQNIVFEIKYCQQGCPFNGTYEARDKESTVFFQGFGGGLVDPVKYLITVKQDFPTRWGNKAHYYIVHDRWESFDKIRELTGRDPLWKMSESDQNLPSNPGMI